MKLKISFDKKAVASFLIEHAEKVVFVIFMFVFVAVVYGAVMRREKFDKAPTELISNCGKAQRSLEGERPELIKTLEENRINKKNYNEEAKKIADLSSKNGISVEPYKWEMAWDPPVHGAKEKRDQPALFDVKDVQATAEFGAFQINPAADATERPAREPARTTRGDRREVMPARTAGGGGSLKGKCWVVLTGLVPIEDQTNAYNRAFRNAVAYDPLSDVPQYMGYYVARLEITSPADLQNPNLKWETFISRNAEDEVTKDWAQIQMDIVENMFTDPAITFPLGPLANRPWGKSVAHAPEIPVYSLNMGIMPEGEANPGGGPTADNPFGNRGENPPAGGRPAVDPYRRMPPGADPRDIRRNMPAHEGVAVTDSEKPLIYKLFRFFDFTVKPGKSYVYRVRLVLKNPNYGIDTGKLKDPNFAKNSNLVTAGTAQSKVIYVPNDTQILAKSVKTRASGDPSGEVYLVKWLETTGQEVQKDFPIDRGQVLNYLNVEKSKAVSGNSPIGAPPDAESVEKTNFVTDATVLDIDGGKKLPGKDRNLIEPGEMLLMFVRGNSLVLMTRNEMDDKSDVERVTKVPETTTRGYDRNAPPDRRGSRDEELLRGEGGRDTGGRPTRRPPPPPPGRDLGG